MTASAPQQIALPADAGKPPAAVLEDVEYAIMNAAGDVVVIASWRWFEGQLRQTVFAPSERYTELLPATVSAETSRALIWHNNHRRLKPYAQVEKYGVYQIDNFRMPPFWSCRIRIDLERRPGELLPQTAYHSWYGPTSTPDLDVNYDALMGIAFEATNVRHVGMIRDSGLPPGYRLDAELLSCGLGGKLLVWDEEAIAETAKARV